MKMKEHYEQSIIEELEILENEHDLRNYQNNPPLDIDALVKAWLERQSRKKDNH
ncbi:hypothetical protein Q5705_03955 [Kosakonia sp. H02]|nr:hypothetical protein Q5705_03955 [Kosakonia sp. H02]